MTRKLQEAAVLLAVWMTSRRLPRSGTLRLCNLHGLQRRFSCFLPDLDELRVALDAGLLHPTMHGGVSDPNLLGDGTDGHVGLLDELQCFVALLVGGTCGGDSCDLFNLS